MAVVLAMGAAQKQALDDRSVATFLHDLQHDVARDDRPAVAARIQYPLIVFAGGVRIPINDAPALLQQYDAVFSSALKEIISEAAMPGPGRSDSAASVTVGADYARVGSDALRIEPAGAGLKITRITVPLGASRVTSATAVSPKIGRDAQRLVIGIGPVVLSATKSQLLEVHINGVSGRDIVARLTNVKRRASIDSRAQNGVRTWIGRIPEDGDYRINVMRLATESGSRLPYLMVVSLR